MGLIYTHTLTTIFSNQPRLIIKTMKVKMIHKKDKGKIKNKKEKAIKK